MLVYFPLVYSPRYITDLPKFGMRRPFALNRGERVLRRLTEEFAQTITVTEPPPITATDALLVHTPEYLDSLREDVSVWEDLFELSDDDYSPETARCPLTGMWDDVVLKSGGTYLATKLALTHRLAASLGGGFHHAFPGEGRGFCAIHDVAIAIRKLQSEQLCRKVLTVDLDFHQGDGTAVIFGQDPDVFTVSLHSAEGWPSKKSKSDLDVAIYKTEAHLYQEKLEEAISQAMSRFTPELVIFLAGSDLYELDELPGTRFMRLSLSQLRCRDKFVIDYFFDRNIPLAMVFAGGYGEHVWEVHYYAVRHLLQRLGTLPAVSGDGTTE